MTDRQYYNSYINYAKLGKTCDTSARVLIDNTKFFSPNNPDYDLTFTQMFQYPGYTPDWQESHSGNVNENPNTEKQQQKIPSKTCCKS